MAEQEVRASHQEVEGFVGKLRDFRGSLNESEQALLNTILDSAQSGETGGFGRRLRPGEDQPEAWQDLVGWIEEQGEEDTQGFAVRIRR